ncbi:hypothetical protein CAter282_0086 [Collimonas arenae]|uniref:Uncharacterized protein n=1 Tax=Collimonas arenae TaxID=279058 RepID=A0A127QCZ9_9BURK|nr:hypothetical protein CAter10_0091 [Collimonas arenae]AMP07910.1 hypothetical protein CAter282_0086 [Collimonas arenae]
MDSAFLHGLGQKQTFTSVMLPSIPGQNVDYIQGNRPFQRGAVHEVKSGYIALRFIDIE